MRFRDLHIGQGFDWISPNRGYNSFFRRCWRIGVRRYRDDTGIVHRVGSINAEVFHTDRAADDAAQCGA